MRRHGFTMLAVILFASLTLAIIMSVSLTFFYAQESTTAAVRQFNQRLLLNNLEAEARGWLINELANGHRPRHKANLSIASMDDLRVLYLDANDTGISERVIIYDLDFEIASLDWSGYAENTEPLWGHREQDFYPPIAGAYLIRAITKPEDEKNAGILLEVIWALKNNGTLELEQESRLRQEIWQ